VTVRKVVTRAAGKVVATLARAKLPLNPQVVDFGQ
jgi:hypothetical protein